MGRGVVLNKELLLSCVQAPAIFTSATVIEVQGIDSIVGSEVNGAIWSSSSSCPLHNQARDREGPVSSHRVSGPRRSLTREADRRGLTEERNFTARSQPG